jgi:hypothetical protein
MPDEADDPIGQARQGANWLVGLSGAAVGGALAKLDWVLKFPTWGKLGFLVGALFFMLSILGGVFYAFQLFSTKLAKRKLDEEKVKQPRVQADLDAATKRLKEANDKVSRFHYLTMGTFAFACFSTVVCLGSVLFHHPPPPPPKPAAVAPNAYTLTTVPVHIGGRLSHSHTFLLNQQTGKIWEMTCHKGKQVEFQRVLRTGFDGQSDEDPIKPVTEDAKTAPSN